jgi:Cys-tRNA(Pro)/Cys-tRNA(Cys) deacylase
MLPSHEFLDQHNISYTTSNFPPATPKGAASVAAVLGLTPHQTVKTLIFQADTGESVLIMVGADQNVISGHLKKIIGSRNIQLADPARVFEITGYQIGSIPPFSWQPEGFHSYLDLSLVPEPILAVGAGVWGNEILITPENLIKASFARVVNLTDRDQPIFPQP